LARRGHVQDRKASNAAGAPLGLRDPTCVLGIRAKRRIALLRMADGGTFGTANDGKLEKSNGITGAALAALKWAKGF